MSDVRLTATNPEDSSVVPVACNAKGQLLLEDPLTVEGPEGPRGPEGPKGPAGKDGEDGADGKDGVSFVPDPSDQPDDLVLTTSGGVAVWAEPKADSPMVWSRYLTSNVGFYNQDSPVFAFDGQSWTYVRAKSKESDAWLEFEFPMPIQLLSFEWRLDQPGNHGIEVSMGDIVQPFNDPIQTGKWLLVNRFAGTQVSAGTKIRWRKLHNDAISPVNLSGLKVNGVELINPDYLEQRIAFALSARQQDKL